ncbi:MAG: cupredoxin domain-containing protein [Anaerolineales bacterium]|nr:cupredoxin domain-containing protein [Anaerolineales bacterium]
MKTLVLGIASLLVIPNVLILWLMATPKPAAVPTTSATGIQQIVVTTKEWAIEPVELSLPAAGQRVRLVVTNEGDVRHNIVIKDLANSEVVVDLGQAGSLPKKLAEAASTDAEEGLIALPAEPGGVAVVEFTVGASGTYQALCTLKGHERRGMKGTAVVP